ncbi:MAG: CaiB/BaiF CoA transferase family protein [Pseudomonadales bacterium]
MPGPMNGVKVIDLGAMVAGPMTATILCDQGADVIKIEPTGIGDVMRYLGANCNGVSGLYHSTNRGKRSLAMDLKKPEAIALLKEMVAEADVVLHNFRPGVAERLGVDYDALRASNPDLIYLSICGFGDRGPYSHKAAYDNVIQAFAGVSHSQADRETGEPAQYYQLFSDKLTALTGSQAISSALFARERGQGGQHIRLSMVDSVVSFLWADVAGAAAFCDEGAVEGFSPSKGVHPTRFKDGYGAIAAASDTQFQAYCEAFGEDPNNPRVASAQDRNDNPDYIRELVHSVAETAATMSTEEAMAALESRDVPCAVVTNLTELPNHPQMQANNSFAYLEHPQAGTVIEPNNPANFDGTPSPRLRPCASLGEHTDEILRSLGRDDAEIDRLRKAGVNS